MFLFLSPIQSADRESTSDSYEDSSSDIVELDTPSTDDEDTASRLPEDIVELDSPIKKIRSVSNGRGR